MSKVLTETKNEGSSVREKKLPSAVLNGHSCRVLCCCHPLPTFDGPSPLVSGNPCPGGLPAHPLKGQDGCLLWRRLPAAAFSGVDSRTLEQLPEERGSGQPQAGWLEVRPQRCPGMQQIAEHFSPGELLPVGKQPGIRDSLLNGSIGCEVKRPQGPGDQ